VTLLMRAFRWLFPHPVFPGDEEQTRLGAVLVDTVGVYTLPFLLWTPMVAALRVYSTPQDPQGHLVTAVVFGTVAGSMIVLLRTVVRIGVRVTAAIMCALVSATYFWGTWVNLDGYGMPFGVINTVGFFVVILGTMLIGSGAGGLLTLALCGWTAALALSPKVNPLVYPFGTGALVSLYAIAMFAVWALAGFSRFHLLNALRAERQRRGELEAAYQQLSHTEALQRATVDNLPVGVFRWDRELRVTTWNPAMHRATGVAAETAIGRPLGEIAPESLREFIVRLAEETLDLGQPIEQMVEVRGIGDRAMAVYQFRTAVERDADGQPVGGLATLADRTDRESLVRSQRTQSLGALAGGIAHDFNNLLTIIHGSISLARASEDPAASARHLQSAETAAERAGKLVQQILSFGRTERVAYHAVQLDHEVAQTLKLIQAGLRPGVRLRAHFAPTLPAVRADGGQIGQVVLNLVTNAAQAIGPKGGAIDVSVEPASALRGEFEGPGVCLVVEDSGAGMDEATRMRIFEPFFTTKPVGEGTGLGLSVVQSIVRAHGGTIRVESEPGRGSRFEVYWPASA
jgi:PAS domain S-box-containing protein